jgi:glutathione S-transferase
MTIKLYGSARSRADRNLWLLFELDAPFEHIEIVQPYFKTSPEQVTSRDESFLKINPNGHIPVIDDDGFVMWESLAINLYLARKFGGPLAPAGLTEEARTAMWSFWALNECEPAGLEVMMNRVNKPPAERDEAKATAAIATLRGPFAVLDAALANSPYLLGERFTVADLNVATIVNRARAAPELFAAFPNVNRWFAVVTARPAFTKTMKMREDRTAADTAAGK